MTDEITMHPNRSRPGCKFEHVGNKDWKKYQRQLWDQGWWPKVKQNAILWMAPSGGQVLIHGSSSDHHALENSKSDARKLGADV